MSRPSDRFDWAPSIDDWLKPDYFKTHDADAFCAHVENLCSYPNTTLDRKQMAQKLIALHFMDPPHTANRNNASTKQKASVPSAPRHGDEQQYAADKPYLLWLGDAHLKQELAWGQTEYYALDTRSGEPHYIVEQYDGQAVAHCWFETYQPVSWDEVKKNAVGLQLRCLDRSNWHERLFMVTKLSTSVSVRWRGSSQVSHECSIHFSDGAFHLTNGGDHGPNDRTGFGKTIELQPAHINDPNAFRAALSHPYDDIFVPLWDFIQKQKAAPAAEGKGNGDLTWTLKGNTLTVHGSSKLESLWNTTDMQRQTCHDPHNLGPWFDQPGFAQKEAAHVHTLILNNGVTGISFLALHGMAHLKVLQIPASVTDVDLRPDSRFIIHTADHTAAAAFARKHGIPLLLLAGQSSVPGEEAPAHDFRQIASVKVSPVPQQHYWLCDIALLCNGKAWELEISDVFTIDRWSDDCASCRVTLPKTFPKITADQLAGLINNVPPCGPGTAGRNVSAAEVFPLIESAHAAAK